MTYQNILDLINLNLASGNKIAATKHREVEIALLNFINENQEQSGDIKMIKSDLAYLNANFESNGIGKNLRLGWRIYSEISGRVPLGYGLGYSELQGTGGFKDAVVIAHSHNYTQYTLDQEVSENGSGVRSLNKNNSQASGFSTSEVGVSGINRNLQPYLITLYIIKI
jgi:hypothetical protein